MRLWRRPPKPPARCWFPDDDGGYYRNCPLIWAEQQEVLAWPNHARGKFEIFADLVAEWYETFAAGVQRKPQLEPGDVVVREGR